VIAGKKMMPREPVPMRKRVRKMRTADIRARRSLRFEIGKTERMKMSSRLGKSRSQSKIVTAPIATKEYMTKK